MCINNSEPWLYSPPSTLQASEARCHESTGLAESAGYIRWELVSQTAQPNRGAAAAAGLHLPFWTADTSSEMERVEDAAEEPGLAPSIDVNDNREEYNARKGSVYSSVYANPGGAGLPSLSPVVGCRAGILNGFPGKLEVDMVCPGGEGTRSGPGTSEAESVKKTDKGYLNSQLRSAMSIMGKTRRIWRCLMEMFPMSTWIMIRLI